MNKAARKRQQAIREELSGLERESCSPNLWTDVKAAGLRTEFKAAVEQANWPQIIEIASQGVYLDVRAVLGAASAASIAALLDMSVARQLIQAIRKGDSVTNAVIRRSSWLLAWRRFVGMVIDSQSRD